MNAMLKHDLYSGLFNYVERKKFPVLRSRSAESFGNLCVRPLTEGETSIPTSQTRSSKFGYAGKLQDQSRRLSFCVRVVYYGHPYPGLWCSERILNFGILLPGCRSLAASGKTRKH